jgi:hypothetical protein
MGRVARAGGEVREERLVGVDLLCVADELDGALGEVLGEVVALVRRGWGFCLVIVVDEARRVLVGVAAEEAVEPLEATTQRPLIVRTRRARRLGRREVPLSQRVRAVALLDERLLE